MLHSNSASITRDLKHCKSTCVCLNVSQSGQNGYARFSSGTKDWGREGNLLGVSLKQHGKGRGGGRTEGKQQGKVGRNMHGTQLYQLLMCNTMAHHAFSASIPAH